MLAKAVKKPEPRKMAVISKSESPEETTAPRAKVAIAGGDY